MIASQVQRLRLAVAPLAALVLTSCASGTVTTPSAVKSTQAKPAVLLASTGIWPVYHRDDAHTGYDPTVTGASGATAGWVSTGLDGTVLAEPLVFNGMVYAATLQGTVYAIDQSTGAIAWSKNVGTPTTWSGQCGNINPLGISGTPAIDTAANRIYVTENLAADNAWHVFAVDLSTHNVVMDSTIPSSLGTGLDWTIEQDRGALALANGYVYVPFGGRIGDCGAYHGWIVAVPTNGSAVTNYYETPGQGAGFWAAGGVVVDDTTGKVFETSGNGTASGCNAVSTGGPPVYENDAVVRLSATLTHEDAFIPNDWHDNWCINDQDLGSATMVLINSSLAFQAGKWGQGFLVNPQALGGQNGQLYPAASGYTGADVCRGNHSDANFGSYAYAAPYVYLSCEGNGLVALSVDTTAKTFVPCGGTCSAPSWNAGGFRPGPPIVAGGAVWAVDTNGGGLYGFNATTGTQIFHSAAFGGVNHFATPSEAGGSIYVASSNVIRSFNMVVTACTSVTISASPPSVAAGTHSTATATATGCPNPRYEFWLRPATSQVWQMVQAYGTANTYDWNSTGAAAGTVYLGVHARDAASPSPYDSVASTPVTVSTPSCPTVSVSASPTSVFSGTHVTLTATATGCTNSPRYEFWLRPATSSVWQMVQAYGTGNTYDWNSTGAAAGTVYLGVHARDVNSLNSYDSVNSTPVTVMTPSCASVTVTASPTTVVHSSSGGTHVTVTATATGCTNGPSYEFWIRPASSSVWQMVQPYGSSNTYDWNSTGAAVGTVYLGVHVRDTSSTAPYDAVASTPVTVT